MDKQTLENTLFDIMMVLSVVGSDVEGVMMMLEHSQKVGDTEKVLPIVKEKLPALSKLINDLVEKLS